MKQMIAEGAIGAVQKVDLQYYQGWINPVIHDPEQRKSVWRLDPEKGGISCCIGDIGVHAASLAEFISGLFITKLSADLESVVEGRELDDDGSVLLRFNNGAKGVLMASQISVGEENNLNIRIYGTKAGLEWHQQDPNTLLIKYNDKPAQLIRTGVGEFSASAASSMRTPAGHPEGYLEAFANLYVDFANQIKEFDNIDNTNKLVNTVPDIDDAVRGMAFIENCVLSSKSEGKWLTV